MGNAQASNKARRQPEWFLKNTVAGGGKFTSLNGWRTKVPGWKPVLLLPNGDMSAWVVPPKTVISGRPLRVVRSDELGSAAVLLESFGEGDIIPAPDSHEPIPYDILRGRICIPFIMHSRTKRED